MVLPADLFFLLCSISSGAFDKLSKYKDWDSCRSFRNLSTLGDLRSLRFSRGIVFPCSPLPDRDTRHKAGNQLVTPNVHRPRGGGRVVPGTFCSWNPSSSVAKRVTT